MVSTVPKMSPVAATSRSRQIRRKRDLTFISLKMAAYSNKSVREYCKGLDCDAKTQKSVYQDSVEKAMMDAINNRDSYMDQMQAPRSRRRGLFFTSMAKGKDLYRITPGPTR